MFAKLENRWRDANAPAGVPSRPGLRVLMEVWVGWDYKT